LSLAWLHLHFRSSFSLPFSVSFETNCFGAAKTQKMKPPKFDAIARHRSSLLSQSALLAFCLSNAVKQ
jgi:hypothetical protein